MFGLFKNLFGKKDPEPPADTRSSQRAPSPGSPPSPTLPPPSQPQGQAKATTFEPLPIPEGPHIKLALKPIIAKLPPSIASVQTQKLPANAECTVPLSKVMDQLALGAVRISFAELYSWSTPKSLTFLAGQEEALIDLPLSEVLKHLGENQISRRPDQKQVEVPEEIENLFGPKGKPVRPVAPAPKPAPGPAPTQPQKDRAPEPSAPRTPPAPPAPTPAPAAKAAKAEPIAEKAIIGATPQPEVAPPIPAHPAPVEPAPPTPQAPLKPAFSLPSPESLRPAPPAAPPAKPAIPTPKPPPPATPVQNVKPAPTAAPSVSAAPGVIKIPLASILTAATGALKESCAGIESSPHEVTLNSAEVESALKKGKFTLTGTNFKAQVSPPLPSAVAAKFGPEPLEIPLSVLVPVFMASRRPTTTQKQIAVTESIPELFPTQKKPVPTPSQPASSPVEKPKPEQPQPATPAVVASKKPATAEDVVGMLAAMKEVQGVVVAMDDGFVVASQVPVGFNIEFISAFVPGAYQRGVELLKALNFEETDHVLLIHDGVQINMIPANTLYLLVFSNPGASIPKAKLREQAELLSKCAMSN